MKKLNDAFVEWENGNIGHKPLIKVLVNPILRFIQFWTNKPYVIASIVIQSETDSEWKFYRYIITRIDRPRVSGAE